MQQPSTQTFGVTPPNGPLGLQSPFYVERPPLEESAYAEIRKPGSLLRLKAPRHMGKSSLLLRVAHQAQILNYKTCHVDFLQADTSSLQDLDTFLRWFCKSVARQLGVSPSLDEMWDADVGSKLNSTIFFEHKLLSALKSPIVLLLNEVNRIFEHPPIAADFLSLLRSWYEQAQRSSLWQCLRMVMAYSTDVYIPLRLEQSPFNVGLQLRLPALTRGQMQDLARRYGLDYEGNFQLRNSLDELFDMVGGHPYLTHLAIAHCRVENTTPAAVLAAAMSPIGLYGEHLRHCLAAVRSQPELVAVLQALMVTPGGVQLPSQTVYQLDSLGLIQYDGRYCRYACELYRCYFEAEFGTQADLDKSELFITQRLDRLEQENRRLQTLAHTDGLTQIPNRRAFDLQLQQSWQQMACQQTCLTLILCDIDNFKSYNDTFGHPIGDECLRRVAQILKKNTRSPEDFVARYGGEEFAVILSGINGPAARIRAEQLRSQVQKLTRTADVPEVTLSVGVASVIPTLSVAPRKLIAAADHALYESKRKGRNRVTLSPTL
jgi:diguanylate cyclase (GGDEF)-like protein